MKLKAKSYDVAPFTDSLSLPVIEDHEDPTPPLRRTARASYRLENRLVTANSFCNQRQFHLAVVDEMEIELIYGMTPTSF